VPADCARRPARLVGGSCRCRVPHSLYGCDWGRLDADLAALHARLAQPGPHDVNPFLFLSAGADAARQLAVCGEHARLQFGQVAPLPALTPATLPHATRLRIGYLSNDFHQHATATLIFPGTLGASFVDYAIVDPNVAPASMADAFAERLAWLPDCYQPNDRLRGIADPPGRAACGLPEQGMVFCCFNHTYKLRPALFDRWWRSTSRGCLAPTCSWTRSRSMRTRWRATHSGPACRW